MCKSFVNYLFDNSYSSFQNRLNQFIIVNKNILKIIIWKLKRQSKDLAFKLQRYRNLHHIKTGRYKIIYSIYI